MLRTASKPVRFFLVALLVCCSVFWAVAGFALADEPSEYVAPADRALQPALPEFAGCPEGVEEAYEAEDDLAARQVTLFRGEFQKACRAQTERLDQVIERLWWVTAQTLALDRADPGLVETNEWLERLAEQNEPRAADLHLIREALTDVGSSTLRSLLVGAEDEKPLPVSGGGEGGGEGTKEVVASIDAAGEASQAGLYVIAGLLAGLFLAACLWKVVDRAT